MTPPRIAPWNLAVRFVLEVGALVGIGLGVGAALGWLPGIAAVVVAIAAWGTFNVVGDPSRSGEAPVEVPGVIRLVLELVILGAGAVGIGSAWNPAAGVAIALGVVVHYATSWSRVRWLLAAAPTGRA